MYWLLSDLAIAPLVPCLMFYSDFNIVLYSEQFCTHRWCKTLNKRLLIFIDPYSGVFRLNVKFRDLYCEDFINFLVLFAFILVRDLADLIFLIHFNWITFSNCISVNLSDDLELN